MASFQASAATSPRANVINSANLSNTSALNFYSSFTSCTSFDCCGACLHCAGSPVCTTPYKPAGTVEGDTASSRLPVALLLCPHGRKRWKEQMKRAVSVEQGGGCGCPLA